MPIKELLPVHPLHLQLDNGLDKTQAITMALDFNMNDIFFEEFNASKHDDEAESSSGAGNQTESIEIIDENQDEMKTKQDEIGWFSPNCEISNFLSLFTLS